MTAEVTVENTTKKVEQQPALMLYRNKKSKMNEAILIQLHPENHALSFHVFAVLLPGTAPIIKNGSVIDTRLRKLNQQRNPFKLLGRFRGGSLTFNRFFFHNPSKEKYEKKLREKYPNKKVKVKKYFHPIVLLMAHFCTYFQFTTNVTFDSQINDKALAMAMAFDEFVSTEIHPTLKAIGKPLYLQGERSLIDYHLTKELPHALLKKLVMDNFLEPVNRQKVLGVLVPPVEGMRKEQPRDLPMLQSYPDPLAITHIVDIKNKMLPLSSKHFPLVIVGEEDARQTLIVNLLKTLNGRFIVFDPKEIYGGLAVANPRVRGYRLGENFFLNIISTEGEKIREQVYAYWFAKIIANTTDLKPELTKTIETYLLGAFRNPSNQSRVDFQFRDFANQELTSEVTKMGRSESITISNVLYPLGTYDEISLLTRIGRSYAFDSLFDTKGAVIQFSKEDPQLTKIAYLFTLLKMRAVNSDIPKVLVIENLDEIIGTTSYKQENDLTDLLLGLAEKFHLIIGIRSPSKVKALFQSTKSKFINRLLLPTDGRLLMSEFRLSSKDFSNLSLFTNSEYLYFLPEFGNGLYLKLDSQKEYAIPLEIDPLEKESSNRIVHSQDFLEREGIAPEIRGAIFEILRLLREKPSKTFPEEGLEELLPDVYSKADILRAKEIARQEAFIKIIVRSPEDSKEQINLIQLTELGEEFYLGYLNLTEKIPNISLQNLALEKNFEKKIFSKLNKIDRQLELGDFLSATKGMLSIIFQLLGAFPEEERFMNGKPAAKLVELWSYLSSIEKYEQYAKAKRLYQEFAHTVANSLKILKHQVLEGTKQKRQSTTPKEQSPLAGPTKNLTVTEEKIQNEHQINFTVTEDAPSPQISQKYSHDTRSRPAEKEDEEDEEEEEEDIFADLNEREANIFHAASADLKSARMTHYDQNGILYRPPKKDIFADDYFDKQDTPDLSDQRSASSNADLSKEQNALLQDQRERLLILKKRVLDRVIRILDARNDKKTHTFLWDCLTSRFSGKVNNGYVISEIVSIIKKSLKKIKQHKPVSEQLISRVELLIEKPNLLSPGLQSDLSSYLKDDMTGGD
ncbi:MAG: hypothetical protein ACTSUA_01510 [Candidatus Heimdallarchaeota archaeon]|nr:MAG: hypothetical protein DRO63_02470 [Candidatus Gerdarchaeota archaeon]RLI69420.1 MAG: hypothetical protein DRP02_10600 [Candidatus Gerdarchaeota archaeon]